MRRPGVMLVAAVLAAAGVLVGVYVLLGGGRADPLAVADPCAPRAWRDPGNARQVAEQVALSALDGAACELGVSREALALALTSDADLRAFSAANGISDQRAEHALRDGLRRAVDDAARAGAIGELEAFLLRQAADRLPVDRLLQAVRGGDLDWVGSLLG